MENIVVIDNLALEYSAEEGKARIKAIDGATLHIQKGSFTAIIGKNGSGKSTLAKCVNALLMPSAGTVVVDGYDTADEANVWEIRQRAGMVFQNPDSQIVSAVVEDDVAFGPENLGVAPDEIRERVDASLMAVNLFAERKKAPHLLSGGQKQRVAIAGVVAMRPKCVLFDEPTAMLDPSGRREVMETIQRLSREGITVVLITHFMDEAALADRVVVMDEGKVVLDGTPHEVFSPASAIKTRGLEAPIGAELAERLRERGVPVPPELIDTEDLVTYLCQYK